MNKGTKISDQVQTRQTVLKTIRQNVWALLHLFIIPSPLLYIDKLVHTMMQKHLIPLVENTFAVRRYNISCNWISNSISLFSSSRQEERHMSYSLFSNKSILSHKFSVHVHIQFSINLSYRWRHVKCGALHGMAEGDAASSTTPVTDSCRPSVSQEGRETTVSL